jgi:cyclase
MLPRDARTWKEELARVTPEPAIFMINTDYHFDHMMTDCLLCDRVIAHSLAEPAFHAQDGEVFEQMVSVFFPDVDDADRREVRNLKTVSPCITFSEILVLNIGSRRIEVTRVGGHTPATSVVHLPDEGILFTGDAHVHDRHPFPGDANIIEWIRALESIEGMDIATIVPGHGDVCDLKSVARLRQFFEQMKDSILELIQQGHGREEVVEEIDLLSFFPVEKGKEERTRNFMRLGVGKLYSQLVVPEPAH